jgi:hypothetical protein
LPIVTCFTREKLSAYAIGLLVEEESDAIAAHLDTCADCVATLTTLDDANDPFVRRLRRWFDLSEADPYRDEFECNLAVARARLLLDQPVSRLALIASFHQVRQTARARRRKLDLLAATNSDPLLHKQDKGM